MGFNSGFKGLTKAEGEKFVDAFILTKTTWNNSTIWRDL